MVQLWSMTTAQHTWIIIINNYCRLVHGWVMPDMWIWKRTRKTVSFFLYEAKQIFKFPVIHWFLDRQNASHFIFIHTAFSLVSPLCLPLTLQFFPNTYIDWKSFFSRWCLPSLNTTVFFFAFSLRFIYYYYSFYIESLKCVKIFSHRFN